MALFGLDLDGPLLPNVDDYINPTKDEDCHRIALNAVVRLIVFSYGGYSVIYYVQVSSPRCPLLS